MQYSLVGFFGLFTKAIYHGLTIICYYHRLILDILLEAVTGIAILILIEKCISNK